MFECILQNQEYHTYINDEIVCEYLRMHQFQLSGKPVSCVNWYIYSYPYADMEFHASCCSSL